MRIRREKQNDVCRNTSSESSSASSDSSELFEGRAGSTLFKDLETVSTVFEKKIFVNFCDSLKRMKYKNTLFRE